MRILFGVLWAIDAVFKWPPGFIGGQTLGDELGASSRRWRCRRRLRRRCRCADAADDRFIGEGCRP